MRFGISLPRCTGIDSLFLSFTFVCSGFGTKRHWSSSRRHLPSLMSLISSNVCWCIRKAITAWTSNNFLFCFLQCRLQIDLYNRKQRKTNINKILFCVLPRMLWIKLYNKKQRKIYYQLGPSSDYFLCFNNILTNLNAEQNRPKLYILGWPM